jgi:hypothetical protein
MVTAGTKGTWIQCQDCGEIFFIKEIIPIDKLYITSFCPICDDYVKGLNCGYDKSDIYLYMNENVDPRFYQY